MKDRSAIPVITIDGPSGSGKGTIAFLLAKQLKWRYLESGALYRTIAYEALQKNISLDDVPQLLLLIRDLDIRFELTDIFQVFSHDQHVTHLIYTENCGNAASKIAAIPEIRTALLDKQRQFRQLPGLVTDGRDMGTVIFPDAPLKIFLLADREERAKRRYKQLKEKRINVSLQDVVKDLAERDYRDETRKVAPLKPAADAVLLDTTALTIDQVFSKIMSIVKEVF